jgi:DNA-binding XRE family transcriptional regulator
MRLRAVTKSVWQSPRENTSRSQPGRRHFIALPLRIYKNYFLRSRDLFHFPPPEHQLSVPPHTVNLKMTVRCELLSAVQAHFFSHLLSHQLSCKDCSVIDYGSDMTVVNNHVKYVKGKVSILEGGANVFMKWREAIDVVRQQNDWRQEDLADFLGLDPSTVSKMGKGWELHWQSFLKLLPFFTKYKVLTDHELRGGSKMKNES